MEVIKSIHAYVPWKNLHSKPSVPCDTVPFIQRKMKTKGVSQLVVSTPRLGVYRMGKVYIKCQGIGVTGLFSINFL